MGAAKRVLRAVGTDRDYEGGGRGRLDVGCRGRGVGPVGWHGWCMVSMCTWAPGSQRLSLQGLSRGARRCFSVNDPPLLGARGPGQVWPGLCRRAVVSPSDDRGGPRCPDGFLAGPVHLLVDWTWVWEGEGVHALWSAGFGGVRRKSLLRLEVEGQLGGHVGT